MLEPWSSCDSTSDEQEDEQEDVQADVQVMRTVLITGSSGGIGRALMDRFRAHGDRVVGLDRQDADVLCDLSDFDEAALLTRIRAATDGAPVGVLINNAAVQITGPFQTLSADDWRASLEVNLIAPARLTRLLLEDLETTAGCVINVASIHATQTKGGFSAYATSKAALSGMTRALATELGSRIRVNAISPAAINTEMLQAGFAGDAEGLAALAAYHPSGRIGEPAEVAHLAWFLASSEAAFINGADVPLDGAISARLHDPG